jgi:small subunit ribosomal protein S5
MEKEIKNLKKTSEAYGTLSEEESLKNAEDAVKLTKEVLEKEIEKELKDEEKELEAIAKEKLEEDIEKEIKKPLEERAFVVDSSWEPKTVLGREVKDKKIKSISEILENDQKILEPEIVDSLVHLKYDLIAIGQSKGKFGGGKRRAWKQTQRVTREGKVLAFTSMAVVGDENGHVGVGSGRSMETLPARDKALRKAKLNLMKITRGCASFDCACSEPHTVPFKVFGKCGSVRVTLIPAPQGTGLVVAKELKKVLSLAGIKDVYSKTFGKQKTSFNLVKACIQALKNTNKKIGEQDDSNN